MFMQTPHLATSIKPGHFSRLHSVASTTRFSPNVSSCDLVRVWYARRVKNWTDLSGLVLPLWARYYPEAIDLAKCGNCPRDVTFPADLVKRRKGQQSKRQSGHAFRTQDSTASEVDADNHLPGVATTPSVPELFDMDTSSSWLQ